MHNTLVRMDAPHQLRIVDALPLAGGGGAGLLAREGAGGGLVAVWPGAAPTALQAPGLAPREGTGDGVWIERLPDAGVLLSWLRPPAAPVRGRGGLRAPRRCAGTAA